MSTVGMVALGRQRAHEGWPHGSMLVTFLPITVTSLRGAALTADTGVPGTEGWGGTTINGCQLWKQIGYYLAYF